MPLGTDGWGRAGAAPGGRAASAGLRLAHDRRSAPARRDGTD